jgi:GT2 family glycosyltransferase
MQQLSIEGRVLSERTVSVPSDTTARLSLPLVRTVSSGTLRLSGPQGHSAVVVSWSDPVLVRRRTVGELTRIARGALAQYGWKGIGRRLVLPDPSRVELAAYHRWLEAQAPTPEQLAGWREEAAGWTGAPTVTVVTPLHNTDAAALRACWQSVSTQLYERWQWSVCDDGSTAPETRAVVDEIVRSGEARISVKRLPSSRHISEASNAAIADATGEYVAFLDHDDVLAPDALFHMVRALRDSPGLDLLYSDEDKLDEAGQRCEPAFKPDWSPDLLRSYMYTCHLTVIRRALLERLGGFRTGFEGAQDYDLWLRASEHTDAVKHVPRILYHWRKGPNSTAASTLAKPEALGHSRRALLEHLQRRGVGGTVEPGVRPGLWRVRYDVIGPPMVSIVVPTDGGRVRPGRSGNLLVECLQSLVKRTAYRGDLEIIVAHNGTVPDAAIACLRNVRHRVVAAPQLSPFNFARKLNFAAGLAEGEHILLLNDDIVVQEPGWLMAMVEHSQQADVGAVGALLRYPDGRLQHVGMLLGVCGVAAHAYHGAPGDTTGYLSSVLTVRNYSAVTGACLMTRRRTFEALGGFDEDLPIDFNDVDYCLRVRQLGLRVVYTPYAQLVHHEAGTIGPRVQATSEVQRFRERWRDVIANDPCYNPNLTRNRPDWTFGD